MKLTKPIVIFDLETTGVDVTKDRIVQIACVKLLPLGAKEEREMLINPIIPIPKGASDIHGITDEDVKDAPTFSRIAKGLNLFLKDCDLGGYNSDSFDIPLLMEEFNRCGISFPQQSIETLDMFQVESKIYSRKLEAAYKRYTGEDLAGAHDALADVNATISVLEGQLLKTGKDSLLELKEIYIDEEKQFVDFSWNLYEKDGDVYYNFGKHRNERVKDNPSYARWMLNNGFPIDTKNALRKIID